MPFASTNIWVLFGLVRYASMGNIRAKMNPFYDGGTMNGNGQITLTEIKALIENVLDGVVDMDGQIHVEDVVSVLREDLAEPAIQEILKITGKEDLTQVVMMFV